MKKIFLGLVVIALILGYSLVNKNKPDSTSTYLSSVPSDNSTSNNSGDTPSPSMTQNNSNSYKDGIYTGSTADAFYGIIQVRATVSGGKLIDVEFLQYPNDRSESVQVNTAAMPVLKSEAIRSQSAQVDIVSGATQSSEAFRQSLQAALFQAS